LPDQSEQPRDADVPEDLRRALADDEVARDAFERLPWSHRREYVDWIVEAKRDETRRRRIEETLARLRERSTAR
jgi:uncharacterized protein YdeI (YjbR/CyaY-like superfamily)